MSKSGSRIAVVGVAVVVLATLLSSAAEARRGIGGPLGIMRFAAARMLSLGGLGRAYHHRARHYRPVQTAALRPQDIRMANNPGGELGNATARGQITAAAALAGWQGGRSASGWWRHDDGSYGWVGPLFWPFAYPDMSDYMIAGDGAGFWAYGYSDIHAGIFAPYGRDALARYLAPDQSGRRHRRAPTLQQFCGDDGSDPVGLPVDRMEKAVQPTDAQRAALDELANASRSAAQLIRASCPAQAPATALDRLAAMKARLEAMIKAAQALQHPLENFYYLLDDEQQARLNALARDGGATSTTGRAGEKQSCQAAPTAVLNWPSAEIAARLRLNETQRAALEVLQDTSTGAAEMLGEECRPKAITALSRLAAVNRRLQSMLQAVSQVSDALDDFYATLSEEQKAQFEAIGPKRTA
jgi:LTXXQ motif family protein